MTRNFETHFCMIFSRSCSLRFNELFTLKIVSSLGDDLEEILPREVPFRLLAAIDKLNDSSISAI